MSTQAALDFQRIEQAIRFIESNVTRQPELADIAAAAHLSEFHFNRLFSRWAGTTPQRFLHFLTKESAKERLMESGNLSELAWETGLSGSGRLHDLFVTYEAMSPGEYRSGGQGLRMVYGIGDTPFGPCLLARTERGIAKIAFFSVGNEAHVLQELKAEWPNAQLERNDSALAPWLRQMFEPAGQTAEKPFHLLLRGTNFQIKVWEALLRIPAGEVANYEQIATAIGAPQAVRAVGSACGRNALAWLIPCHRVIQKTGGFGQYRWGLERKMAMLGWEAGRVGGQAGL